MKPCRPFEISSVILSSMILENRAALELLLLPMGYLYNITPVHAPPLTKYPYPPLILDSSVSMQKE
jgi:hypothetical protein